MNLDHAVNILYVLNLSLFIAGIGLITYKGIYFRGIAQKDSAIKIATTLVLVLGFLSVVFSSEISKLVQAATFASVIVFIAGIAINDPSIQKAHKFFKDKKYKEAVELYEKAMQRFPKKTELYLYCGHAYLSLGQFDKVLDTTERCLKVKPDYAPVQILKMHTLLKLERYQELLDLSALMTSKHPEAKHLFLYRAEAFQRLYKYELAILELDKMKNPDLLSKLERIQLEIKLNRTDKAISDFHALMQNLKDRFPKDQMAHLLTFSSYIRMKERKYEIAIQEQTNAINLDTNYVYAYIDRAFCYILTGKFELAQNDLQMAEKISKSDFERTTIETVKAALLWKTDNLHAALELLENLNAKRKDDVIVLTSLGLIQMLSGLLSESLASLIKAIEIDSHHGEAYYYRYKLLEKMGQEDKAKLDKARIDQWNFRPYFEL